MALTPAVVQSRTKSDVRTYTGGLGASDNDIVVQADDVSEFRTFDITTTAGAADVIVSYDGTTYHTAPISLIDLGSASFATAVVVTASNRVYRFTGCFEKIRVMQAGATPPADLSLRCYR